MIFLKEVCKRYTVNHVPDKWVLKGVSLVIPPKACVGIVGSKGTGKTTLLRLISGSETPTSGVIECNGRVATPTKYNHCLQPPLSGRQNAKFVCRINGYSDDLENRLLRIEKLAGLGVGFNKPVSTYTPLMRMSLSFALSIAFDFEIYISDGFNFSGPTGFKNNDEADTALEQLTERAGIIMTAKGALGETFLKRYCKAGIWLCEGQAKWFDDINDAIEAHRASQPPATPKEGVGHQAHTIPELMQPIYSKIQKMQNLLTVINRGMKGSSVKVPKKEISRFVRIAKDYGLELLTVNQIADYGCHIKSGMVPILQERTDGQPIEYYDLNTQCERLEVSRESK